MSTTSKIVHLPTERRKVNSNKARKMRQALLVEEIAKDLAEVERTFAKDADELIRASQVGGDPC